jgi:predicted glycoside hydrolase/deacetylase ChbG (UPF0249 family)
MTRVSAVPLRIIVNADDLGIRQDINEAIFDGMTRGTITSATILANGPALKHALSSLRQFPRCSFGVHLNLTEFQPVCDGSSATLISILDPNNCFNGNAIRQVKITPAMLSGVYQEWCAQLDRLIGMGVEPSHVDAHHHVHTIPHMLPVLAALRRRYKIKRIRISRNLYTEAELPSRMLLRKKRAYNLALRMAGFKTTRLFTDLVSFVTLCSAQRPDAATVELMTHPGSSRGGEEARLMESRWPTRISYPVTLVSYKEL